MNIYKVEVLEDGSEMVVILYDPSGKEVTLRVVDGESVNEDDQKGVRYYVEEYEG